jgi:type IV pilus assembly protein PilY1
LGDASICAKDGECGINKSSELDPTGATSTDSCYKVGTGALSKIIVFGDNLYANIAGESSLGGREDLIVINTLAGDTDSYRLNWRENF